MYLHVFLLLLLSIYKFIFLLDCVAYPFKRILLEKFLESLLSRWGPLYGWHEWMGLEIGVGAQYSSKGKKFLTEGLF